MLPKLSDDNFEAVVFQSGLTGLKRYLESEFKDREKLTQNDLESGAVFVEETITHGGGYIKITEQSRLSGLLAPDINALKTGTVLNRAFALEGTEAERLALMGEKVGRLKRWLENFRQKNGQVDVLDESCVRRLVDYAYQNPNRTIKPWPEFDKFTGGRMSAGRGVLLRLTLSKRREKGN